jgi:hypothetical protein
MSNVTVQPRFIDKHGVTKGLRLSDRQKLIGTMRFDGAPARFGVQSSGAPTVVLEQSPPKTTVCMAIRATSGNAVPGNSERTILGDFSMGFEIALETMMR